MGSLFRAKSTSVQDPTAVAAFKLAKPFYQQGLGNLGSLANDVNANPAYGGPRVAGLNPFQTGAADFLGGFGANSAGMANNFMNVGMSNLNAGMGIGGNAQDIYNRASMDPTEMILGQANQYANNPYVSGVIDSANRDVVRGLTEQALPSLARGFAATGNTNSTRAGVESAIAERGAADRMADTANTIRSQFFGQGLNMAQNQYNQNLSNMLNANQNLLQAGQFGIGSLGAGQDFANNIFAQGNTAGGLYQGQEQREYDALKSYFDEAMANRLNVNSALVGSAANTKTSASAGVSTSPSVISQIGGFLGAIKPSSAPVPGA
jgi:hypothetical protein